MSPIGSDDEFDALLPEPHRRAAALHFTPVEVALRAAELLAVPGTRVLDVGAGVGKFCIVAAGVARHTTFVGIERRRALVEVADQIRLLRRVDNATFMHGDAFELDWTAYDAFYFFNPFSEPRGGDVVAAADRAERFRADVGGTRERLAYARCGTRVVTYHGFGAALPDGYALVAMELLGTDRLAFWVKETPGSPGARRAR